MDMFSLLPPWLGIGNGGKCVANVCHTLFLRIMRPARKFEMGRAEGHCAVLNILVQISNGHLGGALQVDVISKRCLTQAAWDFHTVPDLALYS